VTTKLLSLLALIASLVAASACSGPHEPVSAGKPQPLPAGNERVQPTYDDKGRLQKIAYDRNGDGKPDAWGYMDGVRVVRVEVDENGDGQIDRWEFHTADATPNTGARPPAPAGQAGVADEGDRTLEHIERATKFDGKVSRWEYFKDGALTRIEEDTDGDGRVDKWETYVSGSLATMSLDTSGRGRADRRLVYRPDGSLERIEADPTGSGQFQPLTP
jgi:hypothetical protein